MIAWLQGLSFGGALLLFGAENLLVLGAALAFGAAMMAWPRLRRTSPPPPPLIPMEVGLAALTVLLNTLVTALGFLLWRAGWIRVRSAGFTASLLDAGVLLLAMDVAMYLLHRMAHHPELYARVHALHHRFEAPRPLTLFVMHPLEVLGFGGLWLALLLVRPATLGGLTAYLALNVAFGVAGHLGVDPLPPGGWVARWWGTPAFHGDHHLDPKGNFGFYSQVWDRLLGSGHE